MTDINRLLIEENEYKPNRYVARTSAILFGVLFVGYAMNLMGFFMVDRILMNILLGISLFIGGIIIYIGYFEATATRPITKYIIMLLVLVEDFCVMIFLAQWVSIILVIPMLLASQYHNLRVNWVTMCGTCLIAVASPPLSLFLGTWNIEYYTLLIKACGWQTYLSQIADQDMTEYYWMTIQYAGLPRLALVIASGTVMFSIARTGRENIENRIKAIRLSETDILTGLYNRISYEKKLEELREGEGGQIICIYADADNLHNLNNTEGHHKGDLMLVTCANLLRDNFRIVYRVGGDEFLAFLRDESLDEVNETLKNINETLSKDNYHMSFGVIMGEDARNVDKLIRETEQAMFDAKRKFYQESGRDRRRR